MNLKTLATLAVCLSGPVFSSQAFAQFSYTLRYPSVSYSFYFLRPHHTTLQVSRVLGSQALGGGATRFTCRTNQGTTVSVDVTPDVWPSIFLYPAGEWPNDPSAEFVEVATKVLSEIRQGNLYDVTLEDVWVNPYFAPTEYKVTARTTISFSQRSVQQYNGVETLVSGVFHDDASSDYWGSFLLRRFSSNGTSADITYPLAKTNNPAGCTIDALRLTDNLHNYGLLNLIESTVRDGAVEIDDYCSGNYSVSGSPARIIHRGSSWHG